jgi:hypothetical protein
MTWTLCLASSAAHPSSHAIQALVETITRHVEG